MSDRFATLVDHYRNRVYTFAYYNLGNREEAEDVTQEVLVRLWQHHDELREATLPAWVSRVTKNACIDTVRRRKAYRARVVANGDGTDFMLAPSLGPSPEQAAHATDLRARIQAALAEIREPYRSIVIFREIQDMKYDQICEALNLPLNTVKSYLHRGRQMLREKLKETLNYDAI